MPIVNAVSWRIGGQQGEGIDSTGDIFSKACARLGLHLYTFRNFSSRIRGGLTYTDVRVSERPISARPDTIDIVVALGQEVVDASLADMTDGGILIYDSDAFTPALPESFGKTIHTLGVPLTKTAESAGNKIMKNMVALGASAQILKMDVQVFYDFVEERFGKKGQKIVDMNKAVIKAGAEHVAANFPREHSWILERRPLPATGRRLVINGSSATAFGALVGGCRFMAAYPITPATDVMEWIIDHVDEYGGFVLQAEDEIAAIHACIGAGYTGVRAMTSTSGPGLSLMTEAVGLAGSAEIPVVIVDVMRPGPSTGLPTKHSQSDLLFAIHGGHDEFPRIVVSPSTTEEAFTLIQEAFNAAEQYQCPVFFLLDQDLSIAQQALDAIPLGAVKINRGKLVKPEDVANLAEGAYHRYQFTDDGVSPRAIPGTPNALFNSTGSEHQEGGFVTENRANRTKMMLKRARKLETYMKNQKNGHHALGDASARIGVITWGSTRGPVEEALGRLGKDGVKTKTLVLTQLWPFPKKVVADFLASVDTAFVVEANFSGQLATLIQQEIGGHDKIRRVNKWDGTPFRPVEIVDKLNEVI
ncbi:MAG TPA: 2-oxoacid:acceptor oxidoreductase subunit alpha [Candidatus Thermoplasmatota archaeon]|nr:2-oxoacid:acceptor oxidoreductase subunit alpha [Candidatus Thermoplasmatota archaeon]